MAKRAVALLSLLLPVACAAPNPADPSTVLRDALASHQASVGGVASAVAVPGEVGEAPPPLNVARVPGAPPTMAGQLVGQPSETLIRLLGQPRLRREEGAAEIWHYQAEACHLDLVLYREAASAAGFRVAFASARATGTARRGEADCLRDIARGAAVRGPSGVVQQAAAGPGATGISPAP